MSFDKQNFARTVQEQQGGIAPQMWPILCPDNGHLVLNQPYEININPCDCIWLPTTYDKSYGVNAGQGSATAGMYMANGAFWGQNPVDIFEPGTGQWRIVAPTFGLRFNSPNNPWLLWGLSFLLNTTAFGTAPGAHGVGPVGSMMTMRSITGPISRMWIQYYNFASAIGGAPVGMNQIVLMSMLGFNQQSEELTWSNTDGDGIYNAPPVPRQTSIHCGGHRTTDLNTADLQALGVKPVTGAPK